MLEKHLKSQVTQGRLRKSIAAIYTDEFPEWLHKQGFKPIVIDLRLRSLASFLEWMKSRNFPLEKIIEARKECKKELSKGRKLHSFGPNQDSIIAASKLILFLQEKGVLQTPKPEPKVSEIYPILGEFRDWTMTHRGTKESTLDLYETALRDLVKRLGGEPKTYTSKLLRQFVIDRAKGHSIARGQAIGVAVRAFIRFLNAEGRCSSDLMHSVPSYSSYRLQKVPRHISAEELKKVEDSCTAQDENGLRDRAVILLLTRLGLRAGDVAALTLKDIDWRGGRLRVSGKSRREEWLPLPQEVGDAILTYIEKGRSKFKIDQIFIKVDAPIGALNRASVTHVVRSALRRAGVKAPVNGAHTLRHSAATAMLSKGISLSGIGAVLRHRSPSTTGIYAKVDFKTLVEVAQPWPEVK